MASPGVGPNHTDLKVHIAQDLNRVAIELNQRPRLFLATRRTKRSRHT